MSNPYAIGDTLSLTVFFDNMEFPFTKVTQLKFLHMSSSTKLDIPMFHMQITDGIEFFKQNPDLLIEGQKVTFDISARNMDSYSFDFRVNASHTEPSNTGDVITIDGYLDLPKYWIETTRRNYIGMTTSEVLKEIADYVGLSYVGPETNDEQNWYGRNTRYHTFCRDVATRGYLSESSCMKMAVNFDSELIYKDISEVDEASQTMTLGTLGMGKIPIVSHIPKNLGGAANRRTGYRLTLDEQTTRRPLLTRTHEKVRVTVNEGGELNLNQDIKTAIRQGAYQTAPIDYGNINENYHRASYQNVRGTGIYTFGLDVVTPVPTIGLGLTLFDTVLVEAPAQLEELAGLYMVGTQTIIIADGQYHEKFELARRSVASAQSTRVVDETNYDSEDSSLFKDQ